MGYLVIVCTVALCAALIGNGEHPAVALSIGAVFLIVIGAGVALETYFESRERNRLREEDFRRDLESQWIQLRATRPCDVCGTRPTTLYFDGVMCTDLCAACASEAIQAGERA